MKLLIYVYLFAVAALALASDSTLGNGREKSRLITWADCAKNLPSPLQGIQLPSTLPSTLKCGQLEVPMDYARPISPTNNITLGFAMYRPKHPMGLINL